MYRHKMVFGLCVSDCEGQSSHVFRMGLSFHPKILFLFLCAYAHIDIKSVYQFYTFFRFVSICTHIELKILISICVHIDTKRIDVSLYWGNEFAILRVFESQKSPFTTKIAGEFPPQVSIYLRYIMRKHAIFQQWPNKSHDVTIETPTNHRSSRQDIVFRSVENHEGITQ